MASPPLVMTPCPQADIKRGDGRLVAEFIEGTKDANYTDGFCRIVKDSVGGRAGELIRLRPWQKNIVNCILRPSSRWPSPSPREPGSARPEEWQVGFGVEFRVVRPRDGRSRL
jgi:hypothetical protein